MLSNYVLCIFKKVKCSLDLLCPLNDSPDEREITTQCFMTGEKRVTKTQVISRRHPQENILSAFGIFAPSVKLSPSLGNTHVVESLMLLMLLCSREKQMIYLFIMYWTFIVSKVFQTCRFQIFLYSATQELILENEFCFLYTSVRSSKNSAGGMAKGSFQERPYNRRGKGSQLKYLFDAHQSSWMPQFPFFSFLDSFPFHLQNGKGSKTFQFPFNSTDIQ